MAIDRRTLLKAAALASAGAAISSSSFGAAPEPLRINAQRLRESIEGLSVFGRRAGGTFADGVSRVAYSDADVAGRKFAMDLMRSARLEPRVDAAGNIFGDRAGSDASLKPILFGSHIDSVPSGGNFDGDLGSLSAIEVIRTLNESNTTTRHPLRVAIWANEEGGLVGSRSAAGELPPEELDRVVNGVRRREGIAKIGGAPDRLAEARIPQHSFHCYIELHIEQGGKLEKAGIPVGVVEGIVSIDEYEAEIRGFANHAGTTPMPERRNALLAAAKLIEAVQAVVTSEPGAQVGTVGRLEVSPNARNVVPGLVRHSIELRDLSAEKIARLGGDIQQRAQGIARETGTEISIKQVEHDPPAVASPQIQQLVERSAATLGLRTMRLPSGAGHDAQMMARLGPMGMIFVPSVGGVSHSPKELTRWEDCANGANVLLHTVLLADQS
ncbi:MAG TPA: Zn-dependent hydrolase [Terriglobales bacterium]|nr:Zn-dependent hydrolase [Terriglobales bacterium]